MVGRANPTTVSGSAISPIAELDAALDRAGAALVAAAETVTDRAALDAAATSLAAAREAAVDVLVSSTTRSGSRVTTPRR